MLWIWKYCCCHVCQLTKQCKKRKKKRKKCSVSWARRWTPTSRGIMTCEGSKNAWVKICEMQIKGQPCLWSIRREHYSFSLSIFFFLLRKKKKRRDIDGWHGVPTLYSFALMSWRGGAATRAAEVGEDHAIVFKLCEVSLTHQLSLYTIKRGGKKQDKTGSMVAAFHYRAIHRP